MYCSINYLLAQYSKIITIWPMSELLFHNWVWNIIYDFLNVDFTGSKRVLADSFLDNLIRLVIKLFTEIWKMNLFQFFTLTIYFVYLYTNDILENFLTFVNSHCITMTKVFCQVFLPSISGGEGEWLQCDCNLWLAFQQVEKHFDCILVTDIVVFDKLCNVVHIGIRLD